MQTPGWRHWLRSGVFIVNFEYVSHLFLVFFFVDFEQVNISWTASVVYMY